MRENSGLPTVPYRQLDNLFRLGEQLWRIRPDVRDVHKTVTSWGYWCWMMFSGAVEHGELQAALYPFQEPWLTERVVGSMPLPDFARDGVVDCSRVHSCLVEAGFDFERPGRMLDLGCGCGRLLRVMARHADVLELHGADVDADAIQFCKKTFDFAEFLKLPHAPPTGYQARTFDAIYAYSVFTHLPKTRNVVWIRELARIAVPGALVVLTTGGRRLVEHYLAGRPDPVPSSDELRARIPELEREGFLFFPYEGMEFTDRRNSEFFGNWDLSEYGMTFLLEDYVRAHWLEEFDLVAFYEAPDDWQDFVVLRRR